MKPHLSINVQNVAESVAFYKKVFGVEPQKQTETYAKFDLHRPALNFAMQSGGTPSRVSHLGIEVDTPDEVKTWEEKLNSAGILKYTEKDSTCCFARQDKAWFADPDGNEWEVFHVYEQLPVKPMKKGSACCT